MTVTLEPTRVEVWRRNRGKVAQSVWVAAVFVVVDGRKLYPPMRVREARKYVKEHCR